MRYQVTEWQSRHHNTREFLLFMASRPRWRFPMQRGVHSKTFELTSRNKDSFEVALRQALNVFMKGDAIISGVRMTFIRDASDFAAAVRSASYTQIVYYGHALEGVNALLPTGTNRVSAKDLASALTGTTVKHFDILGCQSASIAAELSTLLAKVRVGNLRVKRFDNVICDPRSLLVTSLTIDPQPIFHFEGTGR